MDLHSKILDAPPHLGLIFFIFTQFSGRFGQIIDWHHLLGWAPPWEILDQPLIGNEFNTAEWFLTWKLDCALDGVDVKLQRKYHYVTLRCLHTDSHCPKFPFCYWRSIFKTVEWKWALSCQTQVALSPKGEYPINLCDIDFHKCQPFKVTKQNSRI